MTGAKKRYIPESYFDGSITLEVLLMGLLGTGMDPVKVASAGQILIGASDVCTEPELPPWAVVRVHEDGKTFYVDTPKQTYAAGEIRVYRGRRRPAPLPQKRGARESEHWEGARIHVYNVCFRARAEQEEEPSLVAEARVYFDRLVRQGLIETIPDDKTLWRHAAKWREGQGWPRWP